MLIEKLDKQFIKDDLIELILFSQYDIDDVRSKWTNTYLKYGIEKLNIIWDEVMSGIGFEQFQ